MNIAAGGQVRTTSGLNIRSAPAAPADNILATAVKDAILHVVASPAGNWVKVELRGWARAGGKQVYIEPDERGGVKATVAQPGKLETVSEAEGWRFVRLAGYVSTGYVSVIDGP